LRAGATSNEIGIFTLKYVEFFLAQLSCFELQDAESLSRDHFRFLQQIARGPLWREFESSSRTSFLRDRTLYALRAAFMAKNGRSSSTFFFCFFFRELKS
jgi:hypothetical protein